MSGAKGIGFEREDRGAVGVAAVGQAVEMSLDSRQHASDDWNEKLFSSLHRPCASLQPTADILLLRVRVSSQLVHRPLFATREH